MRGSGFVKGPGASEPIASNLRPTTSDQQPTMRPDALDENRACWLDEAPPYAPLPPLTGTVQADVAVVGGGLTGVSTAWHLSQRFPERRIVLLEAKALANGASGRNGGQVLNWINGVDPADPPSARRIYDVTRSGIDLIAEVVARYRLAAGFDRRGCLEVNTTAHSAEAAHARVERMNQAGIPRSEERRVGK